MWRIITGAYKPLNFVGTPQYLLEISKVSSFIFFEILGQFLIPTKNFL
ncbi:hypothetical protein LEP1GSC034_1239 [Leptospira interrogans str. 2003000735]|uniref:Uncharacterized protein n=2 Tax=Leptospira interrogans TaxID=173 RepID=A0A829D3L9_LEPIR|nr:hypothetical protein LEP1GSC027_4100 [Leptospira interrogans str. 2002000624]EKQ39915.1 hypothetical protein LEP1GSC025_1060 [Leptospira interrogans str. 2002000621]EKQ45328.1 hypothetical protein LEP1GSC026_0101 [Leptospira interrogans str. 2002000623]EMJ69152.1 hypothetical protein LEP1GSC033_2087 [Leptospira interrogans str. 2002000632]EMJ73511.1 hypothetical protein LEP1GSC034_1239 [Leptospira interrogans str. 2003000735]EMY03690.1 hypothetical protein LEP1GSC029_3289 [Leptospira interr